MSDPSDRPVPGPQTLVIRAAFVPDGEQPPPEFSSQFDPLHFPATRDPATGEITCDADGTRFGGGVMAQWVADEDPEGAAGNEPGDSENETKG